MKSFKKVIVICSLMMSVSVYAANIKELKIDNAQIVPVELIKSKIGATEGSEYKKGMEDEIKEKLLQTGLFSDVKITKKGGFLGIPVKLNIEVIEHEKTADLLSYMKHIEKESVRTDMIVDSVEIVGNKNIDLKGYAEKHIKVGEFYTPITLHNLVGEIFNTGYFSAVVPSIEKDAQGKSIKIKVDVVENPVIKSVSLTGNTVLNTQGLLTVANLKVGEVLNLRSINPEISPIIQAYRNYGLITARFSKIDVSPDGDVVLAISEGVISNVAFKKNVQAEEGTRLEEKDYMLKTKPFVLDRLNYLKKGDFLTENALNNTVRGFFRTGLFNSVSPAIAQNPTDENGRDVTILLEERPVASINGQASYELNEGFTAGFTLADKNFLGKQQEASIQANVGTKGNYNLSANFFDPWIKDTDRLQIGANIFFKREAVKKSELAKDLDVKGDDVKLPYVLANYHRTSSSYLYGGGITLGKGLTRDIFATLNPKIYGVRQFNAKGYKRDGKNNSKYDILADYTLGSLTASISYDTRDDVITPKDGFFVTGSAELGYVFREKSLTSQAVEDLKKKSIDVHNKNKSEYKDEQKALLDAKDKKDIENKAKLYDKKLNETALNGEKLKELNNEYTKLAKDETLKPRAYTLFNVDARAYHSLIKDKNSMAYRLLFGYASKATPENMLFDSSTQQTTLRGYEGQRTPIMLIGVAENRTYINQYLQLVLFAEAGMYANPKQSDFYNEGSLKGIQKYEGISSLVNFKGAKADLGLGARINTPIGVIRLDYGVPLMNKNKDVKVGKFTFGFGQTF